MMMTVLREESNRAFQTEVQTTNAFRRVIHSSRRREIHLNCLPSSDDSLFPFTAAEEAAGMMIVSRGGQNEINPVVGVDVDSIFIACLGIYMILEFCVKFDKG